MPYTMMKLIDPTFLLLRRKAATFLLLGGLSTAGWADDTSYQDHPASPLAKPGWELTAHDEFDGPELDDSLWIDEYFPGRFGKDTKVDARYYFKDGKIHLHAGGEKNWLKNSKHHVISSIQTYNCNKLHKWYKNWAPTVDKFTQLYGYYEVRAKHVGPSHHIAFWVLQAKPGGAEIDITEDKMKADPSWHAWDAEAPWPAKRKVVRSYDDITTEEQRATTFNLYALEVFEGGARILHNDQVVEEYEVDWKAHGEVPLMFFLGIYGEDLEEKQEYVVDYFRAYQKKG